MLDNIKKQKKMNLILFNLMIVLIIMPIMNNIVLILPEEETRQRAAETARILRQRGYNVEQHHAPQKINKQLSQAEKKGIAYVWLPFADGHKVKNLQTGEQVDADPNSWEMDDE